MPFVACGCFCGPRELELLFCNRRLWLKLHDRPAPAPSRTVTPASLEIANTGGASNSFSNSEEPQTADNTAKVEICKDPGLAKLRKAFPNAPRAQLGRFALGWPTAAEAVRGYEAHLSWRQTEGSLHSLAEARATVPPEWLSRGKKAKDGTDVLFLQVARTDCSIAPEIYFKALCSFLDDLLEHEESLEFKRITVVMDTRGGDGWLNPPATHLLPLLRYCTRNLPPNYPGVLQRILIYPVPCALKFFVSICLAFVDSNTKSRCILISEKHEGGYEKALSEYVCKESLPEHCWPRHEGM